MEESQSTMCTIQKIARWQCQRYNCRYLYDDAVQEGWVAVCQYTGNNAVELAVKRRITRMIEKEIGEQHVKEQAKAEIRGDLKVICWRLAQKMMSENGVVGYQALIEGLSEAGYHLPTHKTIYNWIWELAEEKEWEGKSGLHFFVKEEDKYDDGNTNAAEN